MGEIGETSTAGGSRPNPVIQLTLMRLREMVREPGVLFWVFGFPVLISIALGLAFRTKGPEPTVVGILPGVSAEISQALNAGGVQTRFLDETTARAELRAGRVSLVVLPSGGAGSQATQGLTYRFDPSRPEARSGRATVDDILQRAAGRRDARVVRDQEVRERGARYIDFLIPGLIGMNLMSGSMWGIGWVIVNMRVRRLLKRLLATPMRRRHLLYAQALARLAVIPIEMAVILVFARLAFDVRVTGSWLALAVVSLFGSVSFAAISVLVSSRAQNTETMSGLMNLVMLPMFILSGVFFSASHFPEVMQPAINALPLTALCDGLRAVIVDGARLTDLGRPLVVMGAWGVASFTLGLRWFRWG